MRYLYVPLGGARRRALVIWPVFFFVAVWHDLEVGWVCVCGWVGVGVWWRDLGKGLQEVVLLPMPIVRPQSRSVSPIPS